MQLTHASTNAHYEQIETLYEKSFPSCERKPFSLILEKQQSGNVDVLMLEESGQFAGLAITMMDKDLVLLDYFAIEESMRGKGFGSAALHLLFDFYKGKRFFLEIESTLVPADNKSQRLLRKQFYLANDMTELGIQANVFETDMELLGHNISLTFEEYQNIYRNVYGTKKAAHIILL